MIDPTKPKPDPRPSMTSAQRAAWDHLRFDIEPSVRWQSIVDCCGVCARGAEMEAEELAADAVRRFAVQFAVWLIGDGVNEFCNGSTNGEFAWVAEQLAIKARDWKVSP